jgi:predicted ribosomally synthesized peptide with nif11-like leader
MSVESAVQFLEAAWSDEELKDTVWNQNNLQEIIAVAAGKGYDFAENEFYEAQLEIVDRYDIQLTEEALQSAAGGLGIVYNSGGINCGQNCHDCHHAQSPTTS